MPKMRHVDPLLAIAKVLIIILLIVLGIALAALVIALPVVFFQQEAIGNAAAGSPPWQAVLAVAGAVVLGLIIVAALFRFVQLLGRIVDTVGAGDPFTPVNAHRLWIMGWLTLGVQVAELLLEVLGAWLGTILADGMGGENWHVTIDGEMALSPEGVILAVVLFILARVFRKGAEMREDLEGTV